ncbi:MAG: ATP-binding cassette domain-containing protein [Flavobacteriales bacterium]
MLRIKNLSVTLNDERLILDGINAVFQPNEVYGIAGKSGVGKSTLLKTISGFMDASSGQVLLNDKVLPRASQRLIPGHPEMALVAQDYKLDLYHTCTENIREVILNWEPTKREQRVRYLLKLLELETVADSRANTLSGGEQQRLALARALAHRPSWLLLDEPFSHLDAVLKARLINMLLALKEKEQLCIILVSHDAQDMLGICKHMAFLTKGKLSKFFDPMERYWNLKNLQEARWFGEVNSITWNDRKIRFRPSAYSIQAKGLPLSLNRCFFNGTVFIHYFYTSDKELVVLHSLVELPAHLEIIPNHEQ